MGPVGAAPTFVQSDLFVGDPLAATIHGGNTAGDLVGHGFFGGATSYAFVRNSDGTVQRLERFALAHDINDDGVIVGQRQGRAVMWRPGSLTLIELPGLGGNARAEFVNDDGVIAGSAADAESRWHAVTWDAGTGAITDRGYGTAAGVDAAGNVLATRYTYGTDGRVTDFAPTFVAGPRSGTVLPGVGAHGLGEDGTALVDLDRVIRRDGTTHRLSETENGVTYRQAVGFGVGPRGEVLGFVSSPDAADASFPAYWDSSGRLFRLPLPVDPVGRPTTGTARGMAREGTVYGEWRPRREDGFSLPQRASTWTSAPPTGGEPPECVAQVDFDDDGLSRSRELDLGTNPCSADTDGDALPDGWEVMGVDLTDGAPVPSIDGDPFMDLPEWGSDPLHKDVFVEVDWMRDKTTTFCAFGFCRAGDHHSHRPTSAWLGRVVEAFENAPVANPDGSSGIRLHIDAGPEIDTGEPWTGIHGGGGDEVEHVDWIAPAGEGASPEAVRRLGNPTEGRERVFRYALIGHGFAPDKAFLGQAFTTPGDTMVVTHGSEQVDDVAIAMTFMHELGHGLGLRHGGGDHYGFKPNYLSVMNYATVRVGLHRDGRDGLLDYSRFSTVPHVQGSLTETDGIRLDTSAEQAPGVTAELLARYRVRHLCPGGGLRLSSIDALDLDCDGLVESAPFSAQITALDPAPGNEPLRSQNDWSALVFTGRDGSIGDSGLNGLSAVVDETVPEETTTPHRVSINVPPTVSTLVGAELLVPIRVTNTGTEGTTAVVLVDGRAVNEVGLAPRASTVVTVGPVPNTSDRLAVTAVAKENSRMSASRTVEIRRVEASEVMPGDAVAVVGRWLRSLSLERRSEAHRNNAVRHLTSAEEHLAGGRQRLAAVAIRAAAQQLDLIRVDDCAGCEAASALLRGTVAAP